MILYKLSRYFFLKKMKPISFIFDLMIRYFYRCAIFGATDIGKNTVFAYGGIAVIIHKRAVIGSNCIIGSCVTIGGKSKSIGVPKIGDNVYIASGAKILGDINIGSNCVIGANAVVVTSIPDNCLVAGIPAKILKTNIDPKDYY
ncbi:MAG TPA: serine acetyltransferase [Rheinheimera sp.]|nr:serine acetyltransferase [Rheinheimera sp.]